MWRLRAESTFLFPNYLGRSKETLLAGYKEMYQNEKCTCSACSFVVVVVVVVVVFLLIRATVLRRSRSHRCLRLA